MKYKLLLLTLASVALLFAGSLVVFAQDTPTEDNSEEVEDLEKKIEEYQTKLEDIKSEKASLQKEISYATTQISLTEARIASALAEIAQKTRQIQELAEDIQDLGLRIDKLLKSISFQQDVLSERKRSYYKIAESTPPDVDLLFFLISPSTLTEKIHKFTYSKVMQDRDKELLSEMEKTREAYAKQKGLFEETKLKEEELKKQVEARKASLDTYRVDLVNQKSAKAQLLEETQNDESKYQELLRKATAELLAIQNIVDSIDFKDGDKVDKGDAIAFMGNTGYPDCSTGPHLHFEIRKDGQVVNAERYLKPKKLYVYDYDSSTKTLGSGDWDWPMKSPTVNQRFGVTPWSWRYASGRHDGIDMDSSDFRIYAPEDGILVVGNMGCYGSVIHYAAINHGDGVVSYYLHIQ